MKRKTIRRSAIHGVTGRVRRVDAHRSTYKPKEGTMAPDGSTCIAEPTNSNISTVPNAVRDPLPVTFSLYVVGDRMAPRYEDGELVFINRLMPVKPGDYVLVELEDRSAMVRRLVDRSDDRLVLEQLTPVQISTLPMTQIRRVCHIMTTAEMFAGAN